MHQQRFGSSQQRYVNRTLFLSTWKVVPSVHVTTTCCNKVCQVAGEQISFAQVQGQQSLSITAGLGPQGFEVVDLPVVDQNHLKHNASLLWIFHQVDTVIHLMKPWDTFSSTLCRHPIDDVYTESTLSCQSYHRALRMPQAKVACILSHAVNVVARFHFPKRKTKSAIGSLRYPEDRDNRIALLS